MWGGVRKCVSACVCSYVIVSAADVSMAHSMRIHYWGICKLHVVLCYEAYDVHSACVHMMIGRADSTQNIYQ